MKTSQTILAVLGVGLLVGVFSVGVQVGQTKATTGNNWQLGAVTSGGTVMLIRCDQSGAVEMFPMRHGMPAKWFPVKEKALIPAYFRE